MSEPTPNASDATAEAVECGEGGRAATLTKYASFAPETVHRSRINFAAYNPRYITDAARRKLKANLERVGLLEPVVWNRRTGNVVGGHQRLKCLDALEGTQDYLVPVAAVDLDDATEKAANVFLNNAEAQGEWDLVKLADLLPDIPDPAFTGFDRGDLFQMFGRDVTAERLPDGFGLRPAEFDAPGAEPGPAAGGGEPDGCGGEAEGGRAATPPGADQEWDRRSEEKRDREPGDFFHVIVHKSDAARDAFAKRFGLKPGKYLDPDELVAAVLRGR